MSSVNKVILVGRLGADPELFYNSNGTARCVMSLATSTFKKDKDGNREENTDWHRVVAWGKRGETCKTYLSKGKQIYVEGRLNPYNYVDKAGVKRWSTDVVSYSVVFLGSKEHGSASSDPCVTMSPTTSPQERPKKEEIPF